MDKRITALLRDKAMVKAQVPAGETRDKLIAAIDSDVAKITAEIASQLELPGIGDKSTPKK